MKTLIIGLALTISAAPAFAQSRGDAEQACRNLYGVSCAEVTSAHRTPVQVHETPEAIAQRLYGMSSAEFIRLEQRQSKMPLFLNVLGESESISESRARFLSSDSGMDEIRLFNTTASASRRYSPDEATVDANEWAKQISKSVRQGITLNEIREKMKHFDAHSWVTVEGGLTRISFLTKTGSYTYTANH